MLSLFPEGFEETEGAERLELAVYTDAGGEDRLRAAFGEVESEPVEEGWERTWRRFHRPARVGSLWVGPPWERPDDDLLAVVIDPGLAFGTGSHPTTRLCLELLLDLPPSSLLDLGCGSGVLSIAAAKLGFDPVYALDSDVTAVTVAEENARLNEVALALSAGDALTDPLPQTAIAAANITLDAVELVAERIPAPVLVTSGYLARETPSMPGWRRTERREERGWAADRFERA